MLLLRQFWIPNPKYESYVQIFRVRDSYLGLGILCLSFLDLGEVQYLRLTFTPFIAI